MCNMWTLMCYIRSCRNNGDVNSNGEGSLSLICKQGWGYTLLSLAAGAFECNLVYVTYNAGGMMTSEKMITLHNHLKM